MTTPQTDWNGVVRPPEQTAIQFRRRRPVLAIVLAGLLAGGAIGFAAARATTPEHVVTVTRTVTKTRIVTPASCTIAIEKAKTAMRAMNDYTSAILDDLASGGSGRVPGGEDAALAAVDGFTASANGCR